jgi:hypothetical protein
MEAARQDTRTTVLLICAAFDAQVLINAVSITECVKLLVEVFSALRLAPPRTNSCPPESRPAIQMADRSQKYFRVDYDARLVDGTPFRPNTWMVLDDVRSIEGAAMRVRALHRREAKLRTGIDCVVTVRKVEEVTRKDFDEFLRDSVTGSNIFQRDDTQAEAARRRVLPTVVAEERKKAAALTRKLRRFSRKK